MGLAVLVLVFFGCVWGIYAAWRNSPQRLRGALIAVGLTLVLAGVLVALATASAFGDPVDVPTQLQRLAELGLGLGLAFLGVCLVRLSPVVSQGREQAGAARDSGPVPRQPGPVAQAEPPAV